MLRDLFRKSGRPLERELDLVPVDPLREHRFADGTRLALPSGSRAAQLRRGRRRRSGPGLGTQWVDYVHELRRAVGPAAPRLLRAALRRPGSRRRETDGAAAQPADAAQGRHPARSRTSGCGVAGLHHAVQGGHDPRNVPAWLGLVDYLEQNFGTWTFPGGFGTLAGLLTKRLGERRRHRADLDHRPGPRDGHRPGPSRCAPTAAELDADRVVVAVDPRRLPALAPHVARTMPAIPPTVPTSACPSAVPDLPREVVIHDEYVVTRPHDGTAPPGKAAWTLAGRGQLSEDLVRRPGPQEDRRPRRRSRCGSTGRRASSSSTIRVAVRRAVAGPRHDRRDRLGTVTPLPGVYAAGAHTGGGGWVPFVGLDRGGLGRPRPIGPA